mmetsp:Transcript_109532/g.353502  ORF Transcript_109532/g.353502 Transcript_109532/m.353502 type:complete len:140 (+) Transcript_109532:53-472(+)
MAEVEAATANSTCSTTTPSPVLAATKDASQMPRPEDPAHFFLPTIDPNDDSCSDEGLGEDFVLAVRRWALTSARHRPCSGKRHRHRSNARPSGSDASCSEVEIARVLPRSRRTLRRARLSSRAAGEVELLMSSATWSAR